MSEDIGETLKDPNYFNIDCEGENIPVIENTKIPPSLKNKGMKGMIYMVISALFFSLMAMLMKVFYQNSFIDALEVTYWVNLLMTLFQYIMMRIVKKDPYAVP